MADETKRRRLTDTDRANAKEFVYDTLQTRRGNKFRKNHERHWGEVDRQIQMEPPKVKNKSGTDKDWHNAVQLGLLADALEILSADVMRLAFPGDRSWYAPHVRLEAALDPDTGDQQIDRKRQKATDGVLRSLMSQQHADFGLVDRVKLSVKESLTHGGIVAVTEWQQMAKFHGGSGVEQLSAPVWQPYSMWNAYPDHSEHVIGTDLIYRGSMLLISHMPLGAVKRMKGWTDTDKIKKKDTDEVELVTFYGDLNLARSRGENMFLPNRKTIFVEETLVFSEINKTPYSPVIYTGYERDDIRDPYYTSPLIKRSPTSKMATRSANKFLDSVDLGVEPPIMYEKHDTFFAGNDGPEIAPGARNPTSGAANTKTIPTGDPSVALTGLQWAISEVEKGTGSNAIRQGVTSGNELTATEIVKSEQRGELRTVDFVGVLERQGLRPYLYMQHDLNLKQLKDYPVFNDEQHTPDFIIMSKSDLKGKEAHFQIVGSRSLLGEEQRVARFRDMAGFVLSSEALQERSDVDEILKQGWDDAKVKEPERFLLNADPSMEEKLAQIKAAAQEQIQALTAELEKFQLIEERHKLETEALQMQVQRERTDGNAFREANRIMMETRQAEDRLRTLADSVEKQLNELREIQNSSEEGASPPLEAAITQIGDALASFEEERRSKRDTILREVARISPDVAERVQ